MKTQTFPSFQSDVALVNSKPNNFLKNHPELFKNQMEIFSIDQCLLLLVLDRDGFFYSDVKPEPSFLLKLKENNVFVNAFSVFNKNNRVYGCFLKNFILANPRFKPTMFL